MTHAYSKLVVAIIVSFIAGLSVASFAGFREFLPELLRGALITVQVTLGGAVVAVIAALIAAISKMYGPGPVRWLAITYIETFRGTSALVQLFWLFFVLPNFGILLDPLTVGIVALGLNIGAYGAEVIRGAINSVARGQWEAARALNITQMQALRRIILPQAFIAMIPPWGNLFIELLKATALVSLITKGDLIELNVAYCSSFLRNHLLFLAGVLADKNGRLMYLAISMIITISMRAFERHASRGLHRGRVS